MRARIDSGKHESRKDCKKLGITRGMIQSVVDVRRWPFEVSCGVFRISEHGHVMGLDDCRQACSLD